MEHDRMKVTMTDGVQILFLKAEGKVKCKIFNNMGCGEFIVSENSIHAVIGEPLEFEYYYSGSSINAVNTITLVKEICE